MGELVFGYLQHHGYWETAAAVARDVLGGAAIVSQADVADARRLAIPASCSPIKIHVTILLSAESLLMDFGANWSECS